MSAAIWEFRPFDSVVRSRGSGNQGLPLKEWLPDGPFPVIGQGAKDIEGWTDREDLLFNPPSGVVLYGGHTRRAKHVSHPFVPGPNVKILQPVGIINSKFLYYFLTQLPVESKGYADHFPLVRKCNVPIPSLPEQHRIVAILDEVFDGIATAKTNAEKNLRNAQALFESHLDSVQGGIASLGNFVTIRTGKLDANAATENGAFPFFTCAREIYAIDNYAFDLEAILLAGNNAVGDFNVKHYKGKFNAYQRTYVITVDDQNLLSYRFLYFQMLKSLRHFKEQSVGAGTKFLKLGMIKGLEISLPPIAAQLEIAATLDSLLELTQRLEAIYRRKLVVLDDLKKSLLHLAFSGQL